MKRRFHQDGDGIYLSDGLPLCGCVRCLDRCLRRLGMAFELHRELESELAVKLTQNEAVAMIEDEYWARVANAVIKGAKHE